MPQLGAVTLLVHDYDDALAFYAGKLAFEVTADVPLGDGKRWIVVTPGGVTNGGATGTGVLLARADHHDQKALVGNQTGGRVAFFLHTDDFARDHARFSAAGVTFLEDPREEAYGLVAVFEDLYGNRWDLIQPGA
jgi:catechol 2,3-dioxygenase-like lactoylglutathione lyase family enzyme